MPRAWMPLYIADFLADTQHLNNAAIGAYMLLIMHYWQHENVGNNAANDDKMRRRIARCEPRLWPHIRDQIAPFFHDGWKHKRIDQELEKAKDISEKRSHSAGNRWINSHASVNANGDANRYAKSMHRARASQSHIYKDSLIGAENLNRAVDATTTDSTEPRPPRIFNKMGTKQWSAWEEFCQKTGEKMPVPIPHWETKNLGWYFPTEWPPPTT